MVLESIVASFVRPIVLPDIEPPTNI